MVVVGRAVGGCPDSRLGQVLQTYKHDKYYQEDSTCAS